MKNEFNYKVVDCCGNCKHKLYLGYSVDGFFNYNCNVDNSFDHDSVGKDYYEIMRKWSMSHCVDVNGICDRFENKEIK